MAGAGTPTLPPVLALVDTHLLAEVPSDLEELLSLLPRADFSLQDEVQFAFHPTLTRVWCWKGRRGQRLVEAPGANDKVYGFGLVDWCEGWFDGRLAQVAWRISFALRYGPLSPAHAPRDVWRS